MFSSIESGSKKTINLLMHPLLESGKVDPEN